MSVATVERLTAFRGNDLDDLCDAAEEGIKAGGGFGWLKPPPRPVMEFYENDELGGQYDNWWAPNIDCLIKMIRSAGFVRTDTLNWNYPRAAIKAFPDCRCFTAICCRQCVGAA